MFENIANGIDKKMVDLLGLKLDYDENGIYINGKIKDDNLYILVQNEYSTEVDVSYGLLKRYKVGQSQQMVVEYINTVLHDILKIDTFSSKLKFENKRILFAPLPTVYIAGPEGLEILGK